jgi:hypothetical protein
MTDPLGQAQVIPYLRGLRKTGKNIWLISFEKKERFFSGKDEITELLTKDGIQWIP